MTQITRTRSLLVLLAFALTVATPALAQTGPRAPDEAVSGGEVATAALLTASGEAGGRVASWERMLPEGLQRGVDASVRDLEPTTTYTLLADSVEIITFTTDDAGHARLRLRSPGDEFPPVPDDLPPPSELVRATVLDELGNEVLAGEFSLRPGRRVLVRGQVGEIGADWFELIHGDRSMTVLVGDDTEWRGGLDGLGDLEPEMPVAVAGRLTSDGAILASAVAAWTNPPARVRGEVATIGDNRFELSQRDGSLITVLVDDDTQWRGDLTGLEDLAIGEGVLAVGEWTPDGALLAAGVARWRLPDQPLRVHGEVLALLADGFEMTLADGEVITVLVDDDTAWRGGLSGLADLEVGNRVMVVGERTETEDGALLAVLVALWHRPIPPARVRGEVLTVLADGFEVAGEDGAVVTVMVDDDTAWRGIDGLDALEAGDLVIAAGTWNDDGTLQARVVALWQPHQPPAVVRGEVLSVLANGFELQHRDGSAIQVEVTDDTAWRGGLGGLDDLEVGMVVIVTGEWTGEATLLAHQVAPGQLPPDQVHVRGTVQAVHDNGFDLLSPDGATILVVVDEHTAWRGRLTGLDDLTIGLPVLVIGHWTDDGALAATHVAAAPGV